MAKFKSMKIRIRNEAHSKEVQNALFDAGYKWKWPVVTHPCYTTEPFLSS